MSTSIFRTVGIGRVASNKEIGSKEVEIVPLEWMAFHDGEMKSNPTLMEFTAEAPDGTLSQGAAITNTTVVATWLPASSNRLTAPDVRRGERVELLTIGDSDQYYWRPLGLDDNLRKKETIILGISATDDEADTELRPENMYWIEFSTHSKKLAFSSSLAGGEPFLYEFYFDMEKGEVNLTDNVGNFINLISKLSLIHLQNTKGTSLKLSDKDLLLNAPRDIVASIGRDFIVRAGRDISIEGARSAMIKGGDSFLKLTSEAAVLKAPRVQGLR